MQNKNNAITNTHSLLLRHLWWKVCDLRALTARHSMVRTIHILSDTREDCRQNTLPVMRLPIQPDENMKDGTILDICI